MVRRYAHLASDQLAPYAGKVEIGTPIYGTNDCIPTYAAECLTNRRARKSAKTKVPFRADR
jgi:hypothetical protein